MMFTQALAGVAATVLLAFTPVTNAFVAPCNYQEYRCGYSMMEHYGYTIAELTSAVNGTVTIPPLNDAQLLRTLFRCTDTLGGIAGNSYCIAGCISISGNSTGTVNDMCAM